MSPKQSLIALSIAFCMTEYAEDVGLDELDGYLSFLNTRLTDADVPASPLAGLARSVTCGYFGGGDYSQVGNARVRAALSRG